MGPDPNQETDLYNQLKPDANAHRPTDRQQAPAK